MTVLQHIVAGCATPFRNNLALPLPGRSAHYCCMDENDPNGGPNHLRAWREFRHMSQPELAEAIGTSHQVIGYLERGRTQLSAKWLRRLAPALKATPGLLLDHDPRTLDADLIEIWTAADEKQRRQITDIADTLTRSGTDG
jgi:transcriptional regulator with XRE-family HTH domain